MTSQSIAAQVSDFNADFNAQIGPELSGVFLAEQGELTEKGLPAGAVKAGAELPHAQLVTTIGENVQLAEVLDGSAAVLVFYRGAWCPYCNITLRTYQRELLPSLTEQGVKLIAISPQTPEGSDAAVTNGDLQFVVLSDPRNALSRELGIVTEPSPDARGAHSQLGFDVADSNADNTAEIPFPTVLVVDGSGKVIFADIHVDYTTRTEVDDILDATSQLAAKS